MPWWRAFLCLSTQLAAGITKQLPCTCVLKRDKQQMKKAKQIIGLRLATHLSLTWAIFILVQPRASEDLWVSSCNHSSRLEQFQSLRPLPGKCPRAFPLRLALAHSNTNRFGEQQAWPESRQIWQFFSVWNSSGYHNSWFPSRSSASWKGPPHTFQPWHL